MPSKRNNAVHGIEVQQIQLQNNGPWYTPVADRVKIAQHADSTLIRAPKGGYHVVSMQILPVGDRWAYTCMVEYPVGSGIMCPGSDFIDTKDATGLAKAETSAIGRALGLHGIAIEESIASLEEMRRVAPERDEGETSKPAAARPVKPQPMQPQAQPATTAPARAPNVKELQLEIMSWYKAHQISALALREFLRRNDLDMAAKDTKVLTEILTLLRDPKHAETALAEMQEIEAEMKAEAQPA